MRQISKEEAEALGYSIDPRVFLDTYDNYYLFSKKEMRRRRRCCIGMDKFEAEKKRMTAEDAERIMRCDWYGDKLPKWLRVKYPQLTRGIPHKSAMNIQVVTNIFWRKSL